MDKKIRVAITHGDTNGIGYEVILRAFEDPMMLDMCTPIIYGSPKAAAFHRKAMEIETQYSIINDAAEAKDGRVNLLAAFDEEVKVDFGQPTDESDKAAKAVMQRVKEDMQKHLFDVLVLGPVVPNANPNRDEKPLTIMLSERVRIGLLTNHLPIKEVAQSISVEKIVEKPVSTFKGEFEDELFFVIGKSELRPDEAFKLGRICRILEENPNAKIAITGYADSATGTAEKNLSLSQQRAKVVADMLQRAGITADRITSAASGSDKDASASPESNRVAVCIIK
jgi:outer membrane protein OmpA-like peptidoglycan-associated protein